MSFILRDTKGKQLRTRVVCDCQKAIKDGEVHLVEQSHKDVAGIVTGKHTLLEFLTVYL